MTKENRVAKSLAWIAPALFFLFNPNITVIDPLPDCLGYLFLTIGLSKIADLNEELADAKRGFSRMIFIDAGKLLAILWIFGMESLGERSSSFLLWTFVFFVLELLCAIPAYKKLFDGLVQLGNFYQSTSIFQCPKRSRSNKSITERLKRFTVIFVAMKGFLAFLPELSDLTNLSYDDRSGVVNLYEYIGTMRVLCFIPVLLVGIVWLVRMFRYVKAVRQDDVLLAELETAYVERVLPNQGMFVGRAVMGAGIALVLASILTLDFRVDHFNLLPDFLAFVGFLIFFLLLKKRASLPTGMWVASLSLYGITCVASTIVQILYFSRYSYGSLLRNDGAMILFIVLFCIETAKAFSLLFVGVCVTRTLCAVIEQHTGYVLAQHRHAEVIARHVESVHKELRRYVWYALAAMAVYAISALVYERMAMELGFVGLLNAVCGLIWIAMVWKAQSEIAMAVKTKYTLE